MKRITFEIVAVNNGFSLSNGNDRYVFSEEAEMVEFIKTIIPLKGTEHNFLSSLSDDFDEDEYDEYDEDECEDEDDNLPF